jgi:hypothetical protein
MKFKLLLVATVGLFNCFGIVSAESRNSEIVKTWNNFKSVVESRDCNQFNSVSAKTINCYMCLENTDEEITALNQFKESNPNWYDKLYDEKVFISPAQFCKNDLAIIFNKSLMPILRTGKTIYSKNQQEEATYYEILVTTTQRGNTSKT